MNRRKAMRTDKHIKWFTDIIENTVTSDCFHRTTAYQNSICSFHIRIECVPFSSFFSLVGFFFLVCECMCVFLIFLVAIRNSFNIFHQAMLSHYTLHNTKTHIHTVRTHGAIDKQEALIILCVSRCVTACWIRY